MLVVVSQLRLDILSLSLKRDLQPLCMIYLCPEFCEVTKPKAFIFKRRNSVIVEFCTLL